MKRTKVMTVGAFRPVLERAWTPVRLVGDAVPEFARGIPADLQPIFLASGQYNISAFLDSHSDGVIGGIDVYRRAPEDPVAWNKDWYRVMRSAANPSVLLVDGPYKDDEHWLDEVPKRYAGIEVLGDPETPRKPPADE